MQSQGKGESEGLGDIMYKGPPVPNFGSDGTCVIPA